MLELVSSSEQRRFGDDKRDTLTAQIFRALQRAEGDAAHPRCAMLGHVAQHVSRNDGAARAPDGTGLRHCGVIYSHRVGEIHPTLFDLLLEGLIRW
jgi:hypothetical protein